MSQSRKFEDYQKKLDRFHRLLKSGDKEEIRQAWNKSSELRTLFSGGELSVEAEKYSYHFNMISFVSWYDGLSRAVDLQLGYIVESMLKTHSTFSAWFHGNFAVDVSRTNEKEVRKAFSNELLRHLEWVIISGSKKAFHWFIKDNIVLKTCFSELSAKKQGKYVKLAREHGYLLSFAVAVKAEPKAEGSQEIKETRGVKRSRVESSQEMRPGKRARLSLSLKLSQEPAELFAPAAPELDSSQPDKLKRYYLRGAPTHFKMPSPLRQPSFSVSPASQQAAQASFHPSQRMRKSKSSGSY